MHRYYSNARLKIQYFKNYLLYGIQNNLKIVIFLTNLLIYYHYFLCILYQNIKIYHT